MGDAKDRLGERLREKQKGEEDRYFGAKEREAIARLKVRKEADVVPEARGHCPRCGAKLKATKVHGVEVLQCPTDCGTWLDKGELQVVAQREHDSWLGRLFYSPKLDE